MPTRLRAPGFGLAPIRAMAAGMLLALLTPGAARAEPPILSIEDAACRAEARARVFTTPNPRGLELESVGRQIYAACMRRASGRSERPRRQRRG